MPDLSEREKRLRAALERMIEFYEPPDHAFDAEHMPNPDCPICQANEVLNSLLKGNRMSTKQPTEQVFKPKLVQRIDRFIDSVLRFLDARQAYENVDTLRAKLRPQWCLCGKLHVLPPECEKDLQEFDKRMGWSEPRN